MSKGLKMIGTEGGFSTIHGTTSGYRMNGSKMILFDCGETTRVDMHMKDILEKEKPTSMDIIITHFHSDHFGSLGNSILRNNIFLAKPTTIIFPNVDKVKTLMENIMEMPPIIYNDDKTKAKRMYYIKKPEEIKDYNLKIYDAVHGLTNLDFHLMPMEAYSYLYSDESQNFFYSGDTEEIPNEILEQFLNGKIEHMYLDAQMENWAGHMPINVVEDLIPEEKRQDITLMHLSNAFDIGYAKSKKFRTARN